MLTIHRLKHLIPTLTTNLLKLSFTSTSTKTLTLQQSQQNLKQMLQQKIMLQQQNLQNIAQYEKYFNKQGWTIKTNNAQIQLSKKDKGYNTHVLFNVKILELENVNRNSRLKQKLSKLSQRFNGNQSDNNMLEYNQITVFIRPITGDKWLVAQIIATPQGSQLINIRFIKDFQKQKQLLANNKRNQDQQQIPTVLLGNLQPKVNQSIQLLIEQLGLDDDFLLQAAEFGEASQQRLYIQWMKDLKSLV